MNGFRSLRSKFHTTAHQRGTSSTTAPDVGRLRQSNPFTEADLEFLDVPEKAAPAPKPQSAFSQRLDSNATISDLLEHSLASISMPQRKQPTGRLDRPQSSADKVRDAYRDYERQSRKPGDIAQRMAIPARVPESKVSQEVAEYLNNPDEGKPVFRAARTIRSRPSVGRTIEVNQERGGDFGRALRRLDILCSVNRVRQDLNKQRFHERQGLKKKRLKSERWRKLFRESFRATVGRVQEMRRKGW